MGTKDRLLEFIEKQGLAVSRFEGLSGLSNGYVRNFKGNLGEEKLNGILNAFPELNRVWLLTGEGSMLNTPDQRPSATIEEKTEPPPRNAFRYYYDMDASAGQGALCDTEEHRPFELLNIPGFSGCIGFNVIGESMYPTAKPHDIVAIDPAPITTIVDGEIYMLVTNDGQRMIKRLAMIGRYTEEGKVLCMSDNPDKHRYRDFEVAANEISYTYRVRGFISITRTG